MWPFYGHSILWPVTTPSERTGRLFGHWYSWLWREGTNVQCVSSCCRWLVWPVHTNIWVVTQVVWSLWQVYTVYWGQRRQHLRGHIGYLCLMWLYSSLWPVDTTNWEVTKSAVAGAALAASSSNITLRNTFDIRNHDNYWAFLSHSWKTLLRIGERKLKPPQYTSAGDAQILIMPWCYN